MFWRCVILFLTVSVAWPLPRAGSKSEIRALARLPKAEFAPPLVFDRKSGFVVFPDPASVSTEISAWASASKATPAEASNYLEAAFRFEANADFLNGLKYYAWSADLFRKRIEADPANAPDLAGLALALVSIGRGTEAQTHLQKALAAAPDDPSIQTAASRVFRERAWQAAAGEQRFFNPAPFLDSLAELLRELPDPARIAESRRFLSESAKAIERAVELAPKDSAAAWHRAALLSFRAAFEECLRQVQGGESRIKDVQAALFNQPAMEALLAAVRLDLENPGRLAAAALAGLVARAPGAMGREGSLVVQDNWAQLPASSQQELRELVLRLESMASEGATNAASASEHLGCLQICLLRDFDGARRSFQQAVAREPKRHRSWELLVLSSFLAGGAEELVEICSSRFSSLPSARSSALLAKAYDRVADSTRAELAALSGLAAHPNDFLLNLSLAAILLKRESGEGLWRVNDLVRKAEKQLVPTSSAQNRLDLALIKGIWLALADKPEEARAAIKPHLASSAEARELMRLLER